jgi:CheY-like chemotaxis protein
VDLDEIIEGTLNLLRRLIGENILLEWEPDAHPWTVWMDPSQIDQVLANLVVNARDAIQGQGRVRLQTSRTRVDETYCSGPTDAHPGDYLVLTVSDDGTGMSQEVLSHIFEPFFTTKGLGRGTGLGLATVYGILGQNQGFITVYSEMGRGTTFRLHFPRHAGPADTEEPVDEGVHRGAETILVVEDEPCLLELAERLLATAGYQVLASANPSAALEIARNHSGPIHLLPHRSRDVRHGRRAPDAANGAPAAGHPGHLHVRLSRGHPHARHRADRQHSLSPETLQPAGPPSHSAPDLGRNGDLNRCSAENRTPNPPAKTEWISAGPPPLLPSSNEVC